MKKILIYLIALVMVIGCSLTAFATPVDLDTYVKEDIIDVYANYDYTFTLGQPGDDLKITSVKITGGTFNENKIKKYNSTATEAAYVVIKPEYVYRNTRSSANMTISYRKPGDSTTYKIVVKLDVYPEEKDANDWENIENNVTYSFSGTDTINFEFDHGRYEAHIASGQKDVNLSYDDYVTDAIINQYPHIVDAIIFKGDHNFSMTGKLYFDTTINGDTIYVYELTADGPKEIQYSTKDDAYVQRTRKLGAYIFVDKKIEMEIDEPVLPAPELQEIQPAPTPAPIVPNTNYNPSTGR